MSRPFTGVWGVFPHLDTAAAVVEKLHEAGQEYSIMSPCPRHEFHHAMGRPQSRIPWITMVFGGLGVFFGFGFPTWTSLDWVLPVSGKPIVGVPAFSIIGFELMVLLGGVFTAISIFLLGFRSLRKRRLPVSKRFKEYERFSVDRFGVIVRCEESEAPQWEALMRDNFAEEVVREF